MYSNPQKTSSDEVIELRHKAGQWLKKLREAQGLSQRQLAAAVGVEYATMPIIGLVSDTPTSSPAFAQ
jgi:transcriptional regulator with XRE-family HTH domain